MRRPILKGMSWDLMEVRIGDKQVWMCVVIRRCDDWNETSQAFCHECHMRSILLPLEDHTLKYPGFSLSSSKFSTNLQELCSTSTPARWPEYSFSGVLWTSLWPRKNGMNTWKQLYTNTAYMPHFWNHSYSVLTCKWDWSYLQQKQESTTFFIKSSIFARIQKSSFAVINYLGWSSRANHSS